MAGEHFTAASSERSSARGEMGGGMSRLGLPVTAQRDEVEALRTFTSTEPVGALVTHLRGGTPFRIEFETTAAR
jgi:alanine racemase